MDLFTTATAALLRSNKDRKHPFRLAQLATNGAEYPAVRTIVKREMQSNWDFIFYTDQRSPKVEEITKNPSVSLHFYDPKKQLQIRIKGQAAILENGNLFEEHLKRVKSSKRTDDYCTTAPPSSILQGALSLGEELYFAIIKVQTQEVDILQLSREVHQRLLAKKNELEWEFQQLVP